jgi:hypothetical protein
VDGLSMDYLEKMNVRKSKELYTKVLVQLTIQIQSYITWALHKRRFGKQ